MDGSARVELAFRLVSPGGESQEATLKANGHWPWMAVPVWNRHFAWFHQAKCAKALFASAMRCTLSRFVTAAPSRL